MGGTDVQTCVKHLCVFGRERCERRVEDAEVLDLNLFALQAQLACARHHVGKHGQDLSAREVGVVGCHVLRQLVEVIHLVIFCPCVDLAVKGAARAFHFVQLIIDSHNVLFLVIKNFCFDNLSNFFVLTISQIVFDNLVNDAS